MKAAVARQRLWRILAEQQNRQGWFRSHALPKNSGSRQKIATPYFSFIIATLLLDKFCLHAEPFSPAEELARHLQMATRRERSAENTYNYWLRGSRAARQRSIPDDWDDTALAYAALSSNPEYQDPRAFAILRRSRLPQEPFFQTWIFTPPYPEKWLDRDLWVNLNIAYWLALEDVLLPEQWQACVEGISTQKPTSQYYLDYRAADFFFARAARHILQRSRDKLSPELRRLTLKTLQAVVKRNDTLPDGLSYVEKAWSLATVRVAAAPLKTAQVLAIAEGFTVHQPLEPVILGWQRPNQDTPVYDGCLALTAALLLTALAEPPSPPAHLEPLQARMHPETAKLLAALRASNFTEEILQLPAEIAHLTASPLPPTASLQATANGLGWAYYWLDDQRLDRHTNPIPAPVTPLTLWQEYRQTQAAVLPNQKYPAFWQYWQQVEGQYRKAAKREEGFATTTPPLNWQRHYYHKFAPYLLGVHASLTAHHALPEEQETWRTIYEHYLLAKQYSDDGRDCLEDMRAQRLTVCTQALYPLLAKPLANYSNQEIETLFLENCAPNLTKKVLAHAETALKLLQKTAPKTAVNSGLTQRLRHIRRSMYRLILQRKEVQALQASSASATVGMS